MKKIIIYNAEDDIDITDKYFMMVLIYDCFLSLVQKA